MTESPLQRNEGYLQCSMNRKSKSASPFSVSSPSPLRNIQRRSMRYELLENSSKRNSPLSNMAFSPEANDNCKENTPVEQTNRNSISDSPLTLETDAPICPLQSLTEEGFQNTNDTLKTHYSEYKNPLTPSSVGQSSISNIQRPKSTKLNYARNVRCSPDVNFLGLPTSKCESLPDNTNYYHDQEIESKSKIDGDPGIHSKKGNKKRYSNLNEKLHSTHSLGTLDKKLQKSGSVTTISFSNNSNNGGNHFDRKDYMKYMKYKNASHQDDFQQIMSCNRSASELHSLCSCMTTTDDLMKAQSFLFGISLHQASERDHKGETILHSFSNNKVLAAIIGNPNNEDYETKDFLTLYRQLSIDQNSTDQLNKVVESFLVDKLLPSFFGAPIAQDNDGLIPFEAGLIDWVATCHKEMYGISPPSDTGYFSAYTHKVSDVVTHAWESTSSTFLTAIAFGKSVSKVPRQGTANVDLERGDSMSSAGSTSSHTFGKSKLTPHARFCLRMLSLILDEFDQFTDGIKNMCTNQQMEKYGRAIKGIQQLENVTGPLDLCARVVEKVASIPHLLEVIFSINDDSDFEFVLSTKLIKRVLLDKHSVGPWLTSMLQSPQRQISERAIVYLQTVSRLCSGKEHSHNGKRSDDLNPESVHYEDLIDEVSRLHDFIPSLLALEEKVIEEVSTTLVVKEVMDIMIARPFVATVVFCDAIFLFLMILGFRMAVNGMIMGGKLDIVLKWIYVANTGIFYFIIAEIGKFVSLFLISKHPRNYILSFWNLIDLLAILLAALSSVTMRWQFTIGDETGIKDDAVLRGLLAVTTGFLWLRVLNFLKAINMQLATFVLAILQITKDIFWFCIILLTLVVSFSQMFFTLMAPSTCATGESSGRECKQSEYLLKVYSILLGDFGIFTRDDFASGVSVFLVVLYSFLVTVVLLNVLIAIAADSYEKCLLKSQKLFGRARVMLIAELASFQSLLRRRDQDADSPEIPKTKGNTYSNWWTSSGLSHNWSRGSVLFFLLSMVVTICWTFAELVGYFRGIQVGSILMSFASVLINIALYIIIMIFLDRNSATNSAKKIESMNSSWSNSLQKVVHWVLGVSRRSKKVSSRFSRGQDVWHGRVEYLQREMDRNTERQKELVVAQSECLQNFMNTSETRVRTDINEIDENFKLLEAAVRDELNMTRAINASVLSAVNELRMLISLADGSTSGKTPDIPIKVKVSQT